MDFPVYLRIASWRVHPHLLFETLAYAIGFQTFLRLHKRTGDSITQDQRWWVIAAAAVGAVLGSKLLTVLADPAAILNSRSDFSVVLAGKTIVGGLVGGWVAVEWIKKRIGIVVSTGDAFAVPLAIGIAVGRIGCFLSGLPDQTFGIPTTLPWGVDFGDGVARHPTQLYEVVFLIVLAWSLANLMRRPHRDGDLFKAFMICYMTWRLLIDFLKPYPRVFGLCAIQWICLLVSIYYREDAVRILRISKMHNNKQAPLTDPVAVHTPPE